MSTIMCLFVIFVNKKANGAICSGGLNTRATFNLIAAVVNPLALSQSLRLDILPGNSLMKIDFKGSQFENGFLELSWRLKILMDN